MNRAPKSPAEPAAPAAQAAGEAPLRLVADVGDERDLIERLSPVVHKLLWTLLGPDPERDDLAHEIFIRILRGAKRVRDATRIEQWAARVTVNAVKNEFRRRRLRRLLSVGTEPDVEELRTHSDFEGRELLQRTFRVLESLPARERIPLTLRLFERATAEEIARVSDCSVRSVKRRLKAARARFLSLARRDPLLAARLTSDSETWGDAADD